MSSPEQPVPTGVEPVEPAETVLDETTVTVRRSPRYFNFMIVGAVAGAVAALILTFAFPANAEFDRGQVFGFLLLAGVAFGVAIGCLVALALDRSSRRRAPTVVADRLGGHAPTPPNAVTEAMASSSDGAEAQGTPDAGAASVSSPSRTNTTNTNSE